MEILPDLSICVIARHDREMITGFLRSLFDAPGYVDLQVIVMVADSDLAKELGREFAEALICEEKSLALPDAFLYNRALSLATGRYLALVNEAVVASPAALERLVDFMDDSPDIGLAGSRLVLPSGEVAPSVRRFHSLASLLFLDCLSLKLPLVSRLRRRHFLADWNRESSRNVEWLSSHFLLFRREVLEDIGPLCEGYARQYVDLDYCWRARRAGWHNHFVHDVEMALLEDPGEAVAVCRETLLDGCRFLGRKLSGILA